MNLKDFFAQKDNPPELYWSLVLEEGFVQAGIWYIKQPSGGISSNAIAEVVAISSPVPWETEEELVSSSDTALSSCIQKLPEMNQEPTKTVFGVPPSWSKDGEIKAEFLERIKRLCGELSLTPTGFVVLPEAFAHLFKAEEGTPVNAVIIGLGKVNLEISVFKLGNLVGNTLVARSVSLVDDVIEGLSRFNESSPLPSRIIVFDGKESETIDAQNSLSGVAWEDLEKRENLTNVKFLHTPKVETVLAERKVLATSLAGASEIASVTKIETPYDVTEPKLVTPKPVTLHEVPASTNFGFVVGEDVGRKKPTIPIKDESYNTKLIEDQKQESVLQDNFLRDNLVNKFRMPRFNFKLGSKKLIILSIIFIFIIAALGVFWWLYPKASVAIYVAPKKFEDQFEIAFDESELKTAEKTGEKTKAASGAKKVGDRAKGTVLIRNGTASSINFPTGTFLVSAGDLKYILESSASISAALSPSQPGTASVPVVADTIGAEYNLAKDEVFKVANYPKADVDATSTADFSGGSSRDILAVSNEDQEKLREDLTAEIIDQLKNDLTSQVSSEELVIDDLVEINATSEVFNHKVGDEADNVKLSMNLAVTAVVTNKSKLADTVREKLKDQIPQGFTLRDSQISYQFDFDKESEGKFIFMVSIVANFLPEIKGDDIIKKISGRTPEVVEEYLTSIPGYRRAEIRIYPHFPGIFGVLPRVTKNISIEVTAEK